MPRDTTFDHWNTFRRRSDVEGGTGYYFNAWASYRWHPHHLWAAVYVGAGVMEAHHPYPAGMVHARLPANIRRPRLTFHYTDTIGPKRR